jgi:hypothetical protein
MRALTQAGNGQAIFGLDQDFYCPWFLTPLAFVA